MTFCRRLLRCSAVLLLAFGMPAGAEPPQATRAASNQHSAGKHITSVGLPNFGEVTPKLYRGGQPTPAEFEKLSKMGIGIVVDFGRSERDEKQTKKLGMEYLTIPWHCPFPKDEAFAKFLRLVQENPGKKIFAHCRLGDDRTGMMVAAYRMGIEGWSADRAMNEMKEFGFSRAHHFICPSLASYEKSFPERFRKNKAFAEVRSHEAPHQ
ncbi:MAG TPA: dual specificity protein phosphatase family protein [Candidatus Sulfotelmatobacter sp.]